MWITPAPKSPPAFCLDVFVVANPKKTSPFLEVRLGSYWTFGNPPHNLGIVCHPPFKKYIQAKATRDHPLLDTLKKNPLLLSPWAFFQNAWDPIFGVNMKNMWNQHLVIYCIYPKPTFGDPVFVSFQNASWLGTNCTPSNFSCCKAWSFDEKIGAATCFSFNVSCHSLTQWPAGDFGYCICCIYM